MVLATARRAKEHRCYIDADKKAVESSKKIK
jgi:hypothetical protein